MSELIPKDIPRGSEVVQEGIKIGKTFEAGRSAFLRYRNVHSESDWKRMQAEKGNVQWSPLLGLSTVDEQVEGLKRLWEWGKTKGIEIDRCLSISSTLNGLPLDLRSKAPRMTSFMLESSDDFARIAEAAPINSVFGDHMICSPNSVPNAINALKAGCNVVGVLSQYSWDYPYWHDDVAQVVEVVKALGIMASKRKDGAVIMSYLGDGMTGQLLDNVSIIGYALFEKYVADELCGAAYAGAIGGLHAYIPAKLAAWLALHDVLQSDDHNALTFFLGNTLEPTEDLESNYGLVVADFMPFAVLERKYKTGAAYMVNPVTECLRPPTVDEIIEAYSACVVALRKALELEEAKMLDDSYINELRSILVGRGKQFFKNTLKGLSEMGIDITDPVQLFLAVRRLGGRKLEEMFHPGERDSSRPRGFVPFLPTDLIKQPLKELDGIIRSIRSEQLGDAVKDKKIVIGSTDTHEVGLFVLGGVLNAFGAKVIDGGVDLDAEQVLDLAFKEGTPYIAISTHNGLCLDWGGHLMEVAGERNQHVKVFMGGKLNAMLEGATEPVDISDRLVKLGISTCNEVSDLFKEMAHL